MPTLQEIREALPANWQPRAPDPMESLNSEGMFLQLGPGLELVAQVVTAEHKAREAEHARRWGRPAPVWFIGCAVNRLTLEHHTQCPTQERFVETAGRLVAVEVMLYHYELEYAPAWLRASVLAEIDRVQAKISTTLAFLETA